MCSGWCDDWVTRQHARCNNENRQKKKIAGIWIRNSVKLIKKNHTYSCTERTVRTVVMWLHQVFDSKLIQQYTTEINPHALCSTSWWLASFCLLNLCLLGTLSQLPANCTPLLCFSTLWEVPTPSSQPLASFLLRHSRAQPITALLLSSAAVFFRRQRSASRGLRSCVPLRCYCYCFRFF